MEKVSLSYDLLAEGYDELYREEQEAKYRVVLAAVPPEEPALDAGCGTGLLLEKLHCYAVGVDLSLPMLLAAKRRGRGELADLVCAHAELLPFRSCSFPVAYSVTVVHEAPGLIGEVKRVLRRGGRGVVTLLRKKAELLPEILEQAGAASVVDEPDLKDVVVVLSKS
ncbi:MAG: class I SAM-dependent methyltransferase [Thermofilum sp.]